MSDSSQKQGSKVIRSGARIDCFCPHCSESLVDGERLRLKVKNAKGEQGELTLSPYLNVFESSNTLETPVGEVIADAACPRCDHSLRLQDKGCEVCGSHAAHFQVRIESHATDFYICLRNNCHWHGISEADRSRLILEAEGYHQPDGARELIQSGAKLQCACPLCNEELVRGDELIVDVQDKTGNAGSLSLSPYLNVFNTRCTLTLPPREELGGMSCPHCKQGLLVDHAQCVLCGAKAARFLVKTSRGDVSFFICIRRQCHWHGLDDEARNKIELERVSGSWVPPAPVGS